MFVLCPHCQFLVAVDRGSGAPPSRCPRCRGLLAPTTGTPAPSDLPAAVDALVPPTMVAADAGAPAASMRQAASDSGEAPGPDGTGDVNGLAPKPWDAPPAAMAPPVESTPVMDGAPAPVAAPARIAATATAKRKPARAKVADGTVQVEATQGGADVDAVRKAGSKTRATSRPDADDAVGLHAGSDSPPGRGNESVVDPAVERETTPRIEVAAAAVAGTHDPAIDAASVPESTASAAPATPGAAVPDAAADAIDARVARKRPPRPVTRRWHAPAAIAALAVLLVLQMLLADRAQLAADPQWRPSMLAMCAVLQCDLPPWREPDAFVLIDRDVRPDPARPGVLQVHARFRNDARWPQPWPALALALSDADGRVLGARVFAPREYLAKAGTKNGMASGQVATVSISIREPAPGVVAFTFDFR